MTLKVALLFDCLSLELQEHKFTKFKYAATCTEPQVAATEEKVEETSPLQPPSEPVSSSASASSSAVASSSTDVPSQLVEITSSEVAEAEETDSFALSDFGDEYHLSFDDLASPYEEDRGFINYEIKRRKKANKKPKINKKRSYKKAYTAHKEEIKEDMRNHQISMRKENAYDRITEVVRLRDEWNYKMSQKRPTTYGTSTNVGKGKKALKREEAKLKAKQQVEKKQCQHNHNSNNNNAFVSNEELQLQIALQESAQDSAPCGLSWEMIQLLQTRDITPEDYALLLQLDESVAPKTLDSSLIESFPIVTLTEESSEIAGKEVCMVCLSDYELGDEVRKLPKCGHVFHKTCIDSWLQNNSVKCPLDGLPLADDS